MLRMSLYFCSLLSHGYPGYELDQTSFYAWGRSQFISGRVFIPGRPFPGRPGIPVIFRSRIPGNGAASFPAKTGTVQLMALLSFSIIVTCSRGASSALAWWVTAGCCHTATGVIRLDGVLHPAALCSTRRRVGAMRQFALLAVWLTAQVAVLLWLLSLLCCGLRSIGNRDAAVARCMGNAVVH